MAKLTARISPEGVTQEYFREVLPSYYHPLRSSAFSTLRPLRETVLNGLEIPPYTPYLAH
jgi:hypothetical protein